MSLAFPAQLMAQAGSANTTGINQGRFIAAAEQAFTRGEAVPAWVRPVSALPPAAASGALSLRLADIQFYVSEDSAVYFHRAVTAHEASSLGAIGQLEIEFQPEYQRVQLHALRILREGESIDKLRAADIRFLQRETGLDSGIYSGSVTAAIVTADVRVGDTLEVEYSILGQNPVFGGKFFNAAQWDFPAPVGLRRVILNTPDGRAIHHRLIGGDRSAPPKVDERREGGRRILSFEADNLPAFLGESYVPSDIHPFRWIQFSEYDNWKDVSHWAQELFAAGPADAALQDALKPARAAATQEEAVARVLEFVQNDIRYLSISLGQNSHRPFPPQQVLDRRYGDCKDKSLLMVSMLRELKIEADPVLVATFYRKGLDQFLPSPILFDHAIVRVVVHGKEYFVDPTRLGQHGALDRMGQAHAGNQVLTIAAGTTRLATVAAPAPDASVTHKRIERIVVGALDQPVEIVVRTEMAGVDAESARVQLARMSKEQLRKSFEGMLVKRYPDSQLLGDPLVDDHRERNQLSIETRYRVDKLFTASAQGWSMRYTPSNMVEMFHAPGNARREFAFALPNYPSRTIYEIEVTLPDIFDLPAGSAKKDISNSLFTVIRNLTVAGQSLRLSVNMDLNADRVAPGEMRVFLADLQKFNEVLNGMFYFYKTDLKASAAQKQAPKPATVEEQLLATLGGINRAVADAELAGRDAGEALCERALVRAYLGQSAEALKDALKATQLQPQSAELLRCRADTNFMIGKFKDGENDFTKAMARGADASIVYVGRGMSALFQDRATAAKADFERAAEKAGNGAERLRASIWRTIATAQEAHALPPAAAGNGPADADTAWLTAALEMFSEQATPEHMLGLASRNAGRELDARLVEAYFYAGKYFLLKRDNIKARAYLQRALDKKVLNSTYHIAARHELARLDQ